MKTVKDKIDAYAAKGSMSQAQYDDILDQIQEDGIVDEEESEQLSRLMSLIDNGKVKVVEVELPSAKQVEAKPAKSKEELAAEAAAAAEAKRIGGIRARVQRHIDTGQITQGEHDEILALIYDDGEVDEDESAIMSEMFQLIQDGKITITGENGHGSLSADEREALKVMKEAARARDESKQLDAAQTTEPAAEVKEVELEPYQETAGESSEEAVSLATVASTTTDEQLNPMPRSMGQGKYSISSFINASKQVAVQGYDFELQTDRFLNVRVDGQVWIKTGSMAAYSGSIRFAREGIFEHGIGRLLKKSITQEGTALTKAVGQGRMFLADTGKKISLLDLQGDSIVVNGKDLLAFEDSVKWNISLLKNVAAMWSHGLFNVHLNGDGMIAITTHYDPLTLEVTPGNPVMTDLQSTVAWSGSLAPRFKTDINFKTLIGRGSGETIQLVFDGHGFVVVQPLAQLFVPADD